MDEEHAFFPYQVYLDIDTYLLNIIDHFHAEFFKFCNKHRTHTCARPTSTHTDSPSVIAEPALFCRSLVGLKIKYILLGLEFSLNLNRAQA